MVKKILLGLTAILISSGAIAGELWQKLNTGAAMSVVLQQYPNAVVDSAYNANKIYDSRVTLSNYELFEKNFKVNFLFKDEGLSNVNLSFKGDKKENDALFKKVALGLKSKYGEPLEVNDRDALGIKKIVWTDSDKTITMLSIGQGDTTVSYDSKLTKEINKL